MTPMRSLQRAAIVLVLLSPWEPTPALAASSPGARRRYESIFSLGDSFTDTGNNPAVFAWYSIPDPVTRPPYGSTFFGRPTGRNCDGRLIIDFIGNHAPPLNPQCHTHDESLVEIELMGLEYDDDYVYVCSRSPRAAVRPALPGPAVRLPAGEARASPSAAPPLSTPRSSAPVASSPPPASSLSTPA